MSGFCNSIAMKIKVGNVHFSNIYWNFALQLDVSLGLTFNFMLWQCCTYVLIRFWHKKHLVRVRKRQHFVLKYLFLSPQTQLEIYSDVRLLNADTCQTYPVEETAILSWSQQLETFKTWSGMVNSKKIIHRSYPPVLEPGSAAVSPSLNPTASPPPLWRLLTYRKHVMWMRYRTCCGNVSMVHRTQTNVKVTVFCRNVNRQHFILVTALYSEAADAVCANQHVLFSLIRVCGFLPLTLWYIETFPPVWANLLFFLSAAESANYCYIAESTHKMHWNPPQRIVNADQTLASRFLLFMKSKSSISYLPTACTDLTPPKIFN